MDFNKIQFGKSDLMVAPLAFGGNVFGWTMSESESFSMLDELYEHGFNFIDTADAYSIWIPGHKGGESETIIGKWMKLRGNRDQIVISTKLGMDLGGGKSGLSSKYMKEAVESSLQNLQTDYIDLYFSHQDDLSTDISETMESFNELIGQGKVRYIGASNLSAERIQASNDYAKESGKEGYISLQPLYNLVEREKFETEYLTMVQEDDLAVMSYFALASGFLTGKYRNESDFSKSPRGGGMAKYFDGIGPKVLNAMDDVSAQNGRPLAQIALAWQLQKSFITTPIASATSSAQLNDLMASVTLTLTESQMELLDDASHF